MTEPLTHAQLDEIVTSLGDARLVNLDMSLRNVMQSVSSVLKKAPEGAAVQLHILCCNEYFLVTD
jgi:hypothetical protein